MINLSQPFGVLIVEKFVGKSKIHKLIQEPANAQAFMETLVAQMAETKEAKSNNLGKIEYYSAMSDTSTLEASLFTTKDIKVRSRRSSSLLEKASQYEQALSGYLTLIEEEELEEYFEQVHFIISNIVCQSDYWKSDDKEQFIKDVVEENIGMLDNDVQVSILALDYINENLL